MASSNDSTKMSHDSGAPGQWLNGLLDRLGLGRPELRAWAMYDWANSAMVTTIITADIPIYFEKVALCARRGACAGEPAIKHRYHDRHGYADRRCLSPLGDNRRLQRPEEANAGALPGLALGAGLASVAGMFFIYRGDWIPWLRSCSFLCCQHQRQRQHCLLRRTPATYCQRRRSRLVCRRPDMRSVTSEGAFCWRAEPGVDPEAGVVRLL